MLFAVIILSILLLAAALYILLISMKLRRLKKQHADLSERNQELNAMMHSSELKTLRYKLNPHLFKNALNSIQSHAYQNYYSMDKLSGVLDYILYDSDQPFVSLEEEMAFAANFIEINRMKLSPLFDLRVRNTIEKSNENRAELRIMPLVTVDLIENAFKHTDFQKPESFISISFQLEKGWFQLEVSNRISEKSPLRRKNSGLGLKNLEERLKITYPERYKLMMISEGPVFSAQLKLQLHV
ncbi:MAG TPA: histidine kinase [Fluviicola sp.]|nr:histidine kinase [Fluviicola sp.]